MWKRALETNPDVQSPMVMIGTEKLISCIVWIENQSAPATVFERITCTYRKSTPSNCCQCRVLSMECSDVCKC